MDVPAPNPVPPRTPPKEPSVWFDLLYLTAAIALGAVVGMAVLSRSWGERTESAERAALRAEIAALRLDVDAMRRHLMIRPITARPGDDGGELIPPTALPTEPVAVPAAAP